MSHYALCNYDEMGHRFWPLPSNTYHVNGISHLEVFFCLATGLFDATTQSLSTRNNYDHD